MKTDASQYWLTIQTNLFPRLSEELGPLSQRQQQLVTTLELLRIEEHLSDYYRGPGRPTQDRTAIARAFVAKSIFQYRCRRQDTANGDLTIGNINM